MMVILQIAGWNIDDFGVKYMRKLNEMDSMDFLGK